MKFSNYDVQNTYSVDAKLRICLAPSHNMKYPSSGSSLQTTFYCANGILANSPFNKTERTQTQRQPYCGRRERRTIPTTAIFCSIWKYMLPTHRLIPSPDTLPIDETQLTTGPGEVTSYKRRLTNTSGQSELVRMTMMNDEYLRASVVWRSGPHVEDMMES